MKQTIRIGFSAVILVALACDSGTPSGATSPGEEAWTHSSLSVPASEHTNATLGIASWTVSGAGESRTIEALDSSSTTMATLELLPEYLDDRSQLAASVTVGDAAESVTVSSEGVVEGNASKVAVSLVNAMYADLKRLRVPAAHGSAAEALGDDDGELGVTSQALIYDCGTTIWPGDAVRCGTVFLGESRICITNDGPVHGSAYVSWFNADYGVPPYDQTCFFRWFWGADVYTTNTSQEGVALRVSH